MIIKISEKPVIRQLSVFALCRLNGSDLKVELGVIGLSELNTELRFQTRPRTSGLNRKLSVFVQERVEGSVFELELRVIGPCQFIGELRFQTRPRTSG